MTVNPGLLPAPQRRFATLQFARTLSPLDRSFADPVAVRLSPAPADLFRPASPQEAQIHLAPATLDHQNQLLDAALKSPNPLENLRWLFHQRSPVKAPDAAKADSRIAFVDFKTAEQLKKEEAAEAEKPNEGALVADLLHEEPAQKLARENMQILRERFEKELDALSPGVKQVTVTLPDQLPLGLEAVDVVRELATLTAMRGFNYRFNRADNQNKTTLGAVALGFLNRLADPAKAAEAQKLAEAAELGAKLGQAMMLTRHLVDAPANVCTTQYFVDRAKTIADGHQLNAPGLQMDVLSDADLEGRSPKNNKRMGLLLSVGQGTTYKDEADYENRKPRLLEMTYTPPGWSAEKGGKTIMLVGKGIIFDTGGNNLKPSDAMHNMRGDMAGAAAVLGTMQALKERPIDGVRVVALMPLTENRMSGRATLPTDIHTARSGKTVQISNTDAEGRLVLSDALNYGLEKYQGQVNAAFTIATLTGGKMMGIGAQNAIGVMANHPDLLAGVNDSLRGTLHRQTGKTLFTRKGYDMVTRNYGKGGQADLYNAASRPDGIRAGLITAGVKDPVKDAEAYKPDSPLAKDPVFLKQAMLNSFMDGGTFMVAAGLNSYQRDAHGNLERDAQGNAIEAHAQVPYCHLDIAGAEFGKPDPSRGHDPWATGIGVQDLYLSLQKIAQGGINLDPAKTVTFEKKAAS